MTSLSLCTRFRKINVAAQLSSINSLHSVVVQAWSEWVTPRWKRNCTHYCRSWTKYQHWHWKCVYIFLLQKKSVRIHSTLSEPTMYQVPMRWSLLKLSRQFPEGSITTHRPTRCSLEIAQRSPRTPSPTRSCVSNVHKRGARKREEKSSKRNTFARPFTLEKSWLSSVWTSCAQCILIEKKKLWKKRASVRRGKSERCMTHENWSKVCCAALACVAHLQVSIDSPIPIRRVTCNHNSQHTNRLSREKKLFSFFDLNCQGRLLHAVTTRHKD